MSVFPHEGGDVAAHGLVEVDPGTRIACRDAQRTLTERNLLDHFGRQFADTSLDAHFLTTLHLAIKTAPLVLLSAGRRARATLERYAGALFGSTSPRYLRLHAASRNADPQQRALHERFMAMRLLDQISDATTVESAGRCFLTAIDHVQLDDLTSIVETVFVLDASGTLTLAAPGAADDQQIIVPQQVRIVILLEEGISLHSLPASVLRCAAIVEVPPDATIPNAVPINAPPIGYERLLRRVLEGEPDDAHLPDTLQPRASDELVRLLWRAGETLTRADRQGAHAAVCAAFDSNGTGLFDTNHAQHNATLAYDAYLLTRIAWRLRRSVDFEIQRDLTRFLRLRYERTPQQAVA